MQCSLPAGRQVTSCLSSIALATEEANRPELVYNISAKQVLYKMNNILKNKLFVSAVFLVIAAIFSHRLYYDRTAVNSPGSNNLKENPATSDKFLPLTKSNQLITSSTTAQTSTVESYDVYIGENKLIKVSKVIDGDTIVVDIDGRQIHVRLIGINSPELTDKRTQVNCLAQKAKEEAQKLLAGQSVYLEKDPTQGNYDKYNRLLAYVFLSKDTNFNKLMIENGYAYEYTYRLPYKYQKEFKTAQSEARSAQRGLWNPSSCSN